MRWCLVNDDGNMTAWVLLLEVPKILHPDSPVNPVLLLEADKSRTRAEVMMVLVAVAQHIQHLTGVHAVEDNARVQNAVAVIRNCKDH